MNDFIAVYDDALSPKLCQQIIKRFEKSGQAVPGVTGYGVDKAKKNSQDINITQAPNWQDLHAKIIDSVFPRLKDYMTHYSFLLMGAVSPTVIHPKTGQPTTLNQDNFQEAGLAHLDELMGTLYRYGIINAQKYQKGKGGYPHWHSELYPQDQSCESLHRVLLWMFYLNDVSDGGETEFFYQQKAIKPKQGRMVIAPAGFTHTHRGNVPKSNDKYIITSWVLFKRAEYMYGKPQ